MNIIQSKLVKKSKGLISTLLTDLLYYLKQNVVLSVLLFAAVILIIILDFIPQFRIPVCLDEQLCSSVNDLLLQLSTAYISALIFYICTVWLKWKNRRKLYAWLIYDSLQKVVSSLDPIVDVIGSMEDITVEKVKEIYNLNNNNNNSSNDSNKPKFEITTLNAVDEAVTIIIRLMSVDICWKTEELSVLNNTYNVCWMIKNNLKLGYIDDCAINLQKYLFELKTQYKSIQKILSKFPDDIKVVK